MAIGSGIFLYFYKGIMLSIYIKMKLVIAWKMMNRTTLSRARLTVTNRKDIVDSDKERRQSRGH